MGRRLHKKKASGEAYAPPPLLVQVLGGNAVAAAAVWRCLNTFDIIPLRRLHPAITVAIAGVPWADGTTEVRNIVKWRAALPAATEAWVLYTVTNFDADALAALAGVTSLNLYDNPNIKDAVIARLPPTLRALDVSGCRELTRDVSFAHLTALESLKCIYTHVLDAGLGGLPPSLRQLHLGRCELPATADFSH